MRRGEWGFARAADGKEQTVQSGGGVRLTGSGSLRGPRGRGRDKAFWLASALLGAVLVAVCVSGCRTDRADSGVKEREEKVEYVRPYGPRAPWNVPVAGLARHPASGKYRDLLWFHASRSRPGNYNLNFTEYTYPVYYVADATGEYPVEVMTEWGNLDGKRVPWNPAWRPAPGTDAQIILLDPEQGREWNFWQVEFRDGVVHASNANLVEGNYWTKEDGFASSRGVGIQYLAMLVRPEEVAEGEIRHALSMPIRNTDGTHFVAPATKLEHPGRPEGIPEGMRFALTVTEGEIEEWLASLSPEVEHMKWYGRILARALRDYGWFITDTSGGAHLQHEAWVTAGEEWSKLGLDTMEVGGKQYPRDLLDGLVTRERIYALIPSDQYSE